MVNALNEEIILFQVALERNIIDISAIISWADEYILNKKIRSQFPYSHYIES